MDETADLAFGPSLPRNILDTLFDMELRVRRAHATQMGHPFNLLPLPRLPSGMASLLIGATEDEGADRSPRAADPGELERQVIDWLAQVWGSAAPEDHAGVIGASGTEANIRALHIGREALPDAVLLHGAQAHRSIPDAARLLRIEARTVASRPGGEIDLPDLSRALAGLDGRPVILVLTCGTSVTGGHDDIAGAIAVLEAAGYGADRRFVHLDGALGAMVLPFLPSVPPQIRPDFGHGIDSISTCGHKMIGTPMPCGALVVRKAHPARGARALPSLGDLMGARNGHAVVAMWTRLMTQGVAGFARDALRCSLRAADLALSLRSLGAAVLLNPHSLTVVFPQPGVEILRTYQLPCHEGKAHAIIMPSVSDALIDRFTAEYCDWFRAAGRGD